MSEEEILAPESGAHKVGETLDLGNAADMVNDLPAALNSAPIGTYPGIAAMALHFSLKFHDINTIQDGALYQQYKLEGRNMCDLHLDMVLRTAAVLEKWMVTANERIGLAVLDDISRALDEERADREAGEDKPEPPIKGEIVE